MLTKSLQKNKKSVEARELPNTPSTRKRESCVLSAEKHTKRIRQDSSRHNLEREDTCSSFSPNRTVSPLSISPNRFSFSADMDEASDLAEKVLNGEFPELPQKISSNHIQQPQKACWKLQNKEKASFLKKCKIHPKRVAATGLITWNKSRYQFQKFPFLLLRKHQITPKNRTWLPINI